MVDFDSFDYVFFSEKSHFSLPKSEYLIPNTKYGISQVLSEMFYTIYAWAQENSMVAWEYEKEKYLLLKNKNISEYAPLGMICLRCCTYWDAYSVRFSRLIYSKFSDIW